MLAKSDGIEDIGFIKWDLLLCLLASWFVVILCLIKGIKSSGKVVYFTATFPYVILVALFVRGVTLEGAMDGIYFYLVPDFATLGQISVWQDAAIQVFYSFSIASGAMITYASYNKFDNNLLRDVWIIGIGDMLTSLFSGLVVFTMLGFMALQMGTDVPSVVQSGTGLAFIVYPDAIARMPFSIVWAALFFFMLFLLGIDSQFAMVETLLTYLLDQFPSTRHRKPLVVATLGGLLFLLGIPLTTNGGVYILEVMNEYAAGWPFLVIGLMECCVISYIYGITNFFRDLEEMVGWSPGNWVRSHLTVTLMSVSPLLITGILVMQWVEYAPLKIGNYSFPLWGDLLGWAFALIPLSAIPLAAICELTTKFRSLPFRQVILMTYALNGTDVTVQKIRTLLTPTLEWRANSRTNAPVPPFQLAYDNHIMYDSHALDVISRPHL
ncbi:hypothetical protein LAZ67_3000263 [Cordylochernes scorpioides]|uniref:Uncharacterized protein n=1 Tax=Cordylochernes scorpioides TaxID=51811 RepID=A0ABY6K6Z9_9ARAC|nr:hypothetical protein LAZ67_3000263 [Cordylochernes scorpioides]